MAGYALQNVLSRVYFARQRGREPLVAGAVSIAANIALCALLAERLEVAGLALASALSSTIYALLLLLPLQRGRDKVLDRAALLDLGKMVLAAAGMGLCVQLMAGRLSILLHGGKLGELVTLGLCALAGAALYFLLALILRVEEAGAVLALLKKKQ